MCVPCFVMQYVVSILVCNHLSENKRAGCFNSIVFLLLCGCQCFRYLTGGAVNWFGVSECVLS